MATMRCKLLGPSGLRVSELCLGTMSFGDAWGFGADEKEAHRILGAFADAGGNFIDTADKYHEGQSEEIVGSFLGPGRDRVEEVMRGLDDLVSAGTVLHVALSDAPAWVAAQANTLASWHGWSPLVALQAEYSLLERTAERELLPMAEAFGLSVCAWARMAPAS
jgi:aryl-alcohol dehydrogenase-like predicted oxidoreductase